MIILALNFLWFSRWSIHMLNDTALSAASTELTLVLALGQLMNN